MNWSQCLLQWFYSTQNGTGNQLDYYLRHAGHRWTYSTSTDLPRTSFSMNWFRANQCLQIVSAGHQHVINSNSASC